MKKNVLLTLISLVIFAGSAWGNYKFSYPKEVTLASTIGESKSISLGGTANITAFACSLKTEKKLTTQNMLIGSTKGGSDLYKGNPGGGGSTSYIYHSTEVSCSTATIYFEHPALCAKRTCKNMVFTIATATPSIADATLSSKTTCTFNVFSGTTIYTSDFTSTDKNFAVTAVSLVKDYCYSVTISFSPTAIGSHSSIIKLKGEDAATVSASGVLAAPTNLGVVMDYTKATLSWNAVSGAEKYIITYGDSTKTTTGTNIVCDGLHLGTQYTFSVVAFANNTLSAPASIGGTTNDLAASASITVSNPSYSSVEAQWSAIPDATGYYIVSNNGVVNVFDGHDVTSGTLVGLTPNTTYTFTIYGMYGEEVSKNGKTSNSIGTLETKCDAQGEQDFTLKDCTGGGFDYNEAEKLFTTEMNAPKISFSFEAKNLGVFPVTGYKFAVKESSDNNNWSTAWETEAGKVKSGSKSVQLKKETRYIKVAYAGNFCAQFSNISIYQGSYLEVPETEIDFGNVSIGENPTKDIVVNYSTMVGNVSVSKEISDKFSIDKNQVGKDDCGYGSENIKVTFDGSEQGAYEGTITVGSVNVKVKANVTLQVPTLTASDITYNSAKLSWNAIDGAEKYKLNFIGGNSIETTDIYSVCDTLKLHSSNQFTVQAYGGGQYTDPSNVVTVNTPDLPVTTTFTLSDASYTSMHASWESVQDATGYAIKNENTGIINYYSSDITSATLVGLTPNTEYTFTLYATYNGELATNGKSAIASTLQTKCPAEEFSDKRLGEDCGIFESCAWDWSVKEYVIETGHNNPTLNFGYTVASGSTKEKSINAPDVIVYEYKNGGWQELKKVERAKSDHLSLTATDRAVRKFRITFNGNFYCDIKGVSVTQGIYFEVSPESLDFGKVKVGQSVDTKTVSVSFSTMKGDVVSGNEERFKTSKSIVGADDCGYGVETFDVTANTEAEAGTYESSVTVGSQAIPVKITIEKLPATNVSAAATGKSAISVQWDKVSGATGYKLTCADAGIDVIIPDTGSEHYSYNATGLDESTQYTFTITTMYNAIENESASASATTYATVNVIAAGEAIATTEWTLTGIEGKWNKTENSFEIGSNVTIFASNSDANVIFDKIQYYDGESNTNPTTIPVLDGSVAQTWAGVYFKYSGVAKTDDGEIFQTLNDAVEYSKTHAVSEITLLADRTSENLDVTSGSNITINGQGFKIGDVTVESDAKLTTSGTLIVGDLNIKTEYRNSGEVDPKDDKLQVTGKASFDKILDPSGKVNSNNWYAVCVPFDVNVSDIRGLDADGNEHVMVWDKDYIVDEYNGTKRAATGKGWFDLSANSVLTPGKMYIVAAIKYNTWRFYKTAGSPIVSNLTSITLNEFESSNIKNQGWNAIGNSQIFHVDLSTETEFGQVLVNGKKTYDIVRLSEESFAVAAPLFIQYASGSKDVNLSMKSHGSLRSVSVDNETFNLRIAGSNSTEHADQLFLTASEYALADYVIGRDLVKMGDLTGVSDARIWMKAKSANLCVMDAKLTDGVTVIPLGIYVPKSGNYDFYLNSFADGVKLELLYNGEIIHNFADGSFSTAMAKGTSDSYSLKVSADVDAPIITDVDEVNGVKAYIAENILYVKGLNKGAEYTVYALQNKIASGVANGGVEQIALPAQGVYVVVSGDTTIKLLNE